MVSQLSDVNLKEYKKIEEEWAAALKETPPKEVTVAVDIIYSGNDMRPDKFIVNYFILHQSLLNYLEVLLNKL